MKDLIQKARQASREDPLYVIGIGACTNIASAIIKCPEIIENLVVVGWAATPGTGSTPVSLI